MIEVYENLYVGGVDDLKSCTTDEWAFAHVCKTSHLKQLGYQPKSNDPRYIFDEKGNELSVNWVDGSEARLYEFTGPQGFETVLNFVQKKLKVKKVLVHCDQGVSRAPTVALLYLAKRLGKIPIDSFDSARAVFQRLYPAYDPSGIGGYVRAHWNEIK